MRVPQHKATILAQGNITAAAHGLGQLPLLFLPEYLAPPVLVGCHHSLKIVLGGDVDVRPSRISFLLSFGECCGNHDNYSDNFLYQSQDITIILSVIKKHQL